jgi:hypothetical protein
MSLKPSDYTDGFNEKQYFKIPYVWDPRGEWRERFAGVYHYEVPFKVDLSVLSPAAQKLAKAYGRVTVAATAQEYADTLSPEERQKMMSSTFFVADITKTFDWDIRFIGNDGNLNLKLNESSPEALLEWHITKMIANGWTKIKDYGTEWLYLKDDNILSPISTDASLKRICHEKAVQSFLDYGASCGYDTMSPIDRYYNKIDQMYKG